MCIQIVVWVHALQVELVVGIFFSVYRFRDGHYFAVGCHNLTTLLIELAQLHPVIAAIADQAVLAHHLPCGELHKQHCEQCNECNSEMTNTLVHCAARFNFQVTNRSRGEALRGTSCNWRDV